MPGGGCVPICHTYIHSNFHSTVHKLNTHTSKEIRVWKVKGLVVGVRQIGVPSKD